MGNGPGRVGVEEVGGGRRGEEGRRGVDEECYGGMR